MFWDFRGRKAFELNRRVVFRSRDRFGDSHDVGFFGLFGLFYRQSVIAGDAGIRVFFGFQFVRLDVDDLVWTAQIGFVRARRWRCGHNRCRR